LAGLSRTGGAFARRSFAVRRCAAAATAAKKMAREGIFFLHEGATHPISQFDPARKKAGRSGVGLTPSVAFLFKARPEVHKAKA